MARNNRTQILPNPVPPALGGTARGLRIGLLGGSFNPAHAGHLNLSLEALKRLKLDRVWWMVSPQNPLKPDDGMAPFADRVASAQALARHPRILATDIEERLGTRFTADTLTALTRRYPGHHFVWLMGADNLVQIPAWDRWSRIFHTVPVAIFARPSYSLRALAGLAARRFRRHRLPEREAGRLAGSLPPAWVFCRMRLDPTSASALRARGAAWPPAPPGRSNQANEEMTIARRTKTPPSPKKLLEAVKSSLTDDKAEAIVVIDLDGKSSIADYMVIASGRSQRHVAATAEHLIGHLKAAGMRPVPSEGLSQGDWVLIDGGDVIVHLFRPEVRSFYNLEKMWGHAVPEAAGNAELIA